MIIMSKEDQDIFDSIITLAKLLNLMYKIDNNVHYQHYHFVGKFVDIELHLSANNSKKLTSVSVNVMIQKHGVYTRNINQKLISSIKDNVTTTSMLSTALGIINKFSDHLYKES